MHAHICLSFWYEIGHFGHGQLMPDHREIETLLEAGQTKLAVKELEKLRSGAMKQKDLAALKALFRHAQTAVSLTEGRDQAATNLLYAIRQNMKFLARRTGGD